MFGDKRRHQQYLDSLRNTHERDLRETLARAAVLVGMRLTMRTDTWQHLLHRPALAGALAQVDAARIDGDPADLHATLTVTLAGPQLALVIAALGDDTELGNGAPAVDLAARAVAAHLYPRLADAVRDACPWSPDLGHLPPTVREVRTVDLDSPDTVRR